MGRYLSIFDGVTEYMVGRRMYQQALPDHAGGYFVARTAREALRAVFNLPTRSKLLLAPRVLLRCRAYGASLQYSSGKLAVSSLTPVEARRLDRDVPATYMVRCKRARGV